MKNINCCYILNVILKISSHSESTILAGYYEFSTILKIAKDKNIKSDGIILDSRDGLILKHG
jgi:hypothetical protein